jgi:transposase
MGYTADFKMAAIKFNAKGNSLEQTARTFSIGTGTISRWKRQFHAKESLERKVQDRKHMRKVTPEKIEELLRIKYDMNQEEMAEALGCTSQQFCRWQNRRKRRPHIFGGAINLFV